MKTIIKIVIFISIFGLLWNIIFNILWLPKNNISNFYEEPKNSLDVIYLGSSNVDQYFNPVLAYNLYGFTTGLLTSNSQPFIAIKSLIEESTKTQKPYLYIIDITRSQDDFSKELTDSKIREVTDSMKFSEIRIRTINNLLSNINVDKKEYINYYFSFLKYHNSWKYLNNYLIWHGKSIYKGYVFYSLTAQIVPQEEYVWNNETIELNEKNKKTLLELIDYIKTNNINTLFVVPKMCNFWTPNQEQLNEAISIIESNNLNIMNFNTIDFDINYQTDFYNESHLNVYGSTKYTLYFAKYLKEHYNLPNHKNDNNYISWTKSYLRFKADFQNLTNLDFDKIVLEYSKY